MMRAKNLDEETKLFQNDFPIFFSYWKNYEPRCKNKNETECNDFE